MNQIARDAEPREFSLRRNLSRLLFPRLHRSREAARDGTASDGAARPGDGAETLAPADDEAVETQDAELIVAIFRTVILLIVIFAPRLLGLSSESHAREIWLATLAGIYNIGALIACLLPHRLGLRRPFIIVMDVMLITTWIRLSGQWDLFPFYYVVVVVAAMWFRVIGGTVTALACAVLYMLVWNRFAVAPGALGTDAPPPVLPVRVALEMALLMLIGCVAGYIAQAQEGERRRRLANQLLVAQYQREIDISAQLQPLLVAPSWTEDQSSAPARSTLATLPPQMEVGAALQPARPGYGGDYFDLISFEGGRIGLCIADVSGKSVRAQARLPLLKYALRALAPLYPQPDALMTQLNQTLLPDLQPDFYIALCYVVFDPERETLSWCNAGHMAPLLLAGGAEAEESPRRANESAVATAWARLRREKPLPAGSVTPLAAPGPPLGVFEEARYSMRTLPWRPGDQLLLFTDGLTDMLATATVEGEERVRQLAVGLASHSRRSAQEIAQKLVDSVTSGSPFAPAKNGALCDDVTVIFVRHRATDQAAEKTEAD